MILSIQRRSIFGSERIRIVLVAGLAVVLGVSSSVTSSTLGANAPIVSSISPQKAKPGQVVTINGSGFGAVKGTGYVHLNDSGSNWGAPHNATLHVTAWSATAISFTLPVPSGTQNQWRVVPGTLATVTVTQSSATSNAKKLAVAATANPADYYGNIGISPDTHRLCGANFDVGNAGDAYSADLLLKAGIKPGGLVKAGGLTFSWPSPANCYYDNIIADGQTILMAPKHGATRLGLLGASANATRSGTLVIHYTDGSSSHSLVALSDWGVAAVHGNTVVAHMKYRNTSKGPETKAGFSIFLVTAPVTSSKIVASVTLPKTIRTNQSMRIFALSLNGIA